MLGGFFWPTLWLAQPLYIASIPGFLLVLAFLSIGEPERGRIDSLPETARRGTLRGLSRNGAYWTATLGMAAMTFALGGLSVWMPTFLPRARDLTPDRSQERPIN